MKQLYVKGTNTRITGTLEQLSGVAIVNGFDDDLQPLYEGSTEIWWDGQRTVMDEAGHMVYVDEDNVTYRIDEVEAREEEES